ncbi:hypothetical protein LAZ40_04815 [Cereibacter sphaeroides]|uniref:hypothetical protein n=1 Tax=Cereibacter sphaeroides TaxID=1063 RepID=UPI001F27B485|nr:hypothetical protein [Cereibacter sphaeroides]MCE6958378.1 hypothetical protein [Cereibacter sphaeroides]MCE6972245.1 hypothetical protein [Cereibacter sphaeroides]
MKTKFRKRLGIEPPPMPAPVPLPPPPEAGEVHPGRYPQHADPAKGQVFGGLCNRTACGERRAVWWNVMTHGFYCRTCANGINDRLDQPPICIRVEKKPTFNEMNELQHGWNRGEPQAAQSQ